MKTLAEVERDHILAVLEECGGDKLAAADRLKIGKTTIYHKLKKWGTGNGRFVNVVRQAQPLAEVKQSRFLRLPRTRGEKDEADLECPKCHAKVMLPNGRGTY
jgi:hypothetical protein